MIESSFLSEGEMGLGLNSVRNFITLGGPALFMIYSAKERLKIDQASLGELSVDVKEGRILRESQPVLDGGDQRTPRRLR